MTVTTRLAVMLTLALGACPWRGGCPDKGEPVLKDGTYVDADDPGRALTIEGDEATLVWLDEEGVERVVHFTME